jgi:hypothetical protein
VVVAPGDGVVAENQLSRSTSRTIDADGEPIASLTAANLPAGATFTPAHGNTGGTLTWDTELLAVGQLLGDVHGRRTRSRVPPRPRSR